MSTLLVQSCSASKNRVEEPTPAIDVYSGYFFRIIKKATREGELRDDLDICILSAEHGVLDTDEDIEYYDREMDESRALELRESVLRDIRGKVNKNCYSRIVVNMGKPYQEALEGIDQQIDAEVHSIEGDGIGDKGQKLKRFIRGSRMLAEPQ